MLIAQFNQLLFCRSTTSIDTELFQIILPKQFCHFKTGFPIGNTVIINAEDGRGYYIPETPEDIDIALRKNGSRIKKLLAKEECLQAVKKQMMKGGAL